MKKFFVSLGVLVIGSVAYVYGRVQGIITVTDISTEVIGASLMAVILFLALKE